MFGILDVPWWYYLTALTIGICVGVWKKPAYGLFTGYVFLLLVETVLLRHPFLGDHFQPQPLWSWKVWNIQKNQILTNIVMFIPVGILSGYLWKWRGLIAAAGLSAIIEIIQLTTSRGLCELDDVLHNSMGAVLGLVIVMLVRNPSR